MSMFVPVFGGRVTVVDREDYDSVIQHKWHHSRKGYVERTPKRTVSGKQRSPISLARELLDAPRGMHVDHINGDILDNRRCNLRLCNNSENLCNQMGKHLWSSTFKGVCWDKSRKKWLSQLQVRKKHFHLGRFDNETEAALAYNEAAIKYHGEFARLNVVE